MKKKSETNKPSSQKANRSRSQTVKPKARTFQDQEIDRMLVTGEEVILRAQLHGAIYWKSVAVLIVACLVFVIAASAAPIAILLLIVGLLMLCITILTQHYLLLAVTNKRVLARYGLLQMDVVDIRLSKIESIDLERMLPGHIFGYASVVVMGTGTRMIRVPFIRNAEAFRRYYNEMVLADEGSEEGATEAKSHRDEAEKTSAAESKTLPKRK